jgi:hypothetical protein
MWIPFTKTNPLFYSCLLWRFQIKIHFILVWNIPGSVLSQDAGSLSPMMILVVVFTN